MVETDVFDYAIGAYFSQPDEQNRLYLMAFYLRKMNPAEINYNIHDKELLVIIVAFQEWRVYLKGPRHIIKVFINYKNLTYFIITKV